MRILYLTEEAISFSDAMVRGGAIHVRKVVEGLRERGHEVHLVDWNDDPERSFQHSITPRTRFVDGPFRTGRQAVNVARSEGVDVVVSKTRKTYLPGLIAARLVGVPHIVHVGSLPSRTRDGFVDRLDASSLRLRLQAPHDAFFVVCEAIADGLRRIGVAGDRIYNVRNAVDTTAFAPGRVTETPSWLQRVVDESGDAFTIGYVGGLYEYKGVRDIPPAVDRGRSDVHVFVVGDGPERAWLKGALGEHGTLLGSIPYDAMPAVYAAVDALVLPSYTEGLPRVVLEAQATETPVVATRVGGVPEVIEDRVTGLLFEPGDVAGLDAKIDELATDSELYEQIRQNGRRSVQERWSWGKLYDRYERHLERVVG